MKKVLALVLATAAVVLAAPNPAEAAGETVWMERRVVGTNHLDWLYQASITVDKYTGSEYIRGTCRTGQRCIVVQPGRITDCERPDSKVGCAQTGRADMSADGLTCTITVDTRSVPYPSGGDYWKRLYAHELGHCHCLVHSSGNDLMWAPLYYPSYGKGPLVQWLFTAAQRTTLSEN